MKDRLKKIALWHLLLPVAAIMVLLWSGGLDIAPLLLLGASFLPLAIAAIRANGRKADVAMSAGAATSEPYGDIDAIILRAIPDPVLAIDSDRVVVEASPAAQAVLGKNIIGRDITLSLRQPSAVRLIGEALQTGQPGAMPIVLYDPSERQYELLVAPFSRSQPPGQAALEPGAEVSGAVILLRDVTAQKHSEQMRADFVANASHELRTPLASLIGFIETLQNTAADDEEARNRFLSIMGAEANRMARLIDDLLSLSRIERDEHRRPEGEVMLSGVLRSVAESFDSRLSDRQMTISLTLPDNEKPVVGDRDQLTQVFQNLVDNALKYGDEDTAITLSVSPVDRLAATGGPGYAVAVNNKGAAIPREQIPRLTDRFYRVDPSRSRALGSTGLGLAIVKHIVNRHRGALAIDSRAGEGTTVTVSLPLYEK